MSSTAVGLPAPDGDGVVLGVDREDLLRQVGLHHLLDLGLVLLAGPLVLLVAPLVFQVLQEPNLAATESGGEERGWGVSEKKLLNVKRSRKEIKRRFVFQVFAGS